MELKPKGIAQTQLVHANIGQDYWECDFSNFMGSSSAKEASIAYLRDLETMKEKGIGILYGGPPGPGKTTAAVITLKYLVRAGWDCWMTSLSEIVEEIKKGWEDKDSDAEAFLKRCRETDFLLIDDLGKEHIGPSGFTATVFDNLIRYRSQHRLPTFITTNLKRNEIRGRYGDALLSLIEGKCKVVVVNGDDVRRTVLKEEIKTLAVRRSQ